MTIKTDTVITISLKEYARLQVIEKAAQEAVNNAVFYDSNCSRCCDYTFDEHDEDCVVEKLAALLKEGEE
jgi:hypothetical protein